MHYIHIIILYRRAAVVYVEWFITICGRRRLATRALHVFIIFFFQSVGSGAQRPQNIDSTYYVYIHNIYNILYLFVSWNHLLFFFNPKRIFYNGSIVYYIGISVLDKCIHCSIVLTKSHNLTKVQSY